MRRLICILCGLLTVSAVTAAVPSAAARSEGVAALRVEGTMLTADGRPVVLRGVSYGWHNLWPRFYNASTVGVFAREWQVDAVRAAMGVDLKEGWLERPRRSERLVRRVVEAAVEEGIYVIIDWHCHRLLPRQATRFFTRMARRYRGVKNVIYEICNEPDDRYTWPEVKAYAQQVLAAIRRQDPDALVLIGSPHWDQDVHLAADDPLEDAGNVMYTLHFYAGTHRDELRSRAEYARSKGLPLFVSECGASEATGDGRLDRESWRAWRAWMRTHGLSWLAWSVGDKAETSALLLPSASSEGPWSRSDLSPWGELIFEELKLNR